MTKGVLFDFWGTIVENGTYSPLRQTYQLLRPKMLFSPFVVKFEETVMTKQFEDQATAFTEACKAVNVEPKPFIIEKLIGIWNTNKLLAKPYPETLDTLKALKEKGMKLAIVTNSMQGNIDVIVEKYKLNDYFDKIFVSCDIGLLKQDKKCFAKVLKDLKIKKAEAVMVGDSMQTDIEGAENAGIKAVLVDRRDRRDYKNKIVSLTQIEEHL